MNKSEIVNYLEENKDERGIKNWERAGVKEMRSYGIGITKLKAFAKKAGKNHKLALELWNEAFFETKVLATLIDDPKLITREQINSQVKELDFWMLASSYCGNLLSKYPKIQPLAEDWIESKDDLERRCGFHLLYQMAKNNKNLPDEYFIPIVRRIEKEIQHEENFVKDAMNNTLWTIGMRSKNLNKLCIKVAKNIGTVEVDYGENSCEALNVIKHLTSDRLQKKIEFVNSAK